MRIAFAILAIGFVICLVPDIPAVAKSYRITDVHIDAQLHADGSMDVKESRGYRFEESFTFAYRDLPTGGPVKFENFGVSEAGRPYRLSDAQAPGTYRITNIPGGSRIIWYYEAEDESRTFEFHYRALNAIERFDDAAVLYYKFLSEEWDRPQYNISITLRPPKPVATDQINQWLHGPLWARSQITRDGRILAQCERLGAYTYLEIRALYPPELFPDTPAVSGPVRQRIMAQEAAWAEEANRRRQQARIDMAARAQRRRTGRYLAIAIGLAGLLGSYLIFQRYHNKPALPTFLEMTSEIPDDTPPALVGYLLGSRQVAGSALIATMLDLARRGFVKLHEKTEQVKHFWGGTREKIEYYWEIDRAAWKTHEGKLLDFEKSLLAFIFDDLAEGADSISISRIKKKRTAFTKFFRQWKKQVGAIGKQKEWFDSRSIRGMYYSLALGIVLAGLSAVALMVIGPWGTFLSAAAIAVMIIAFCTAHRTAEGETKARHWQAVRKYLKKYEFRRGDHKDVLARISEYLVYGAVLGLSTKLYSELAAYIPEGAHGRYVPWYIYGGHGTGEFSPGAFGEAFSSMVATTTSAMSTAAGTGGGASAGGGGGASSGGGGAG
jgi:uncharacterized membrane protein